MNSTKKLYIAYGSNLNLPQMADRCPTAKVAGASELRGYRLLFRGANGGAVATMEPCPTRSVPVLVWEITPADEAALDRYEGYPFLYRKETLKINLGGKNVKAMVYIMNTGDPGNGYRPLSSPGVYYYNIIREGYMSAGFDINILRKATSDSVE